MDCATCKKIIDLFESDLDKWTIDLGHYDELMSTGCLDHAALLDARYSSPYHGNSRSMDQEMRTSMSSQIRVVKRGATLIIKEDYGEILGSYCVNPLIRVSDVSLEEAALGKLLDPQWIDINQIKDWIQTCDKNHRNECNSRMTGFSSPDVRPRLLIDTEQKCLIEVSVTGPVEYTCLSYVWGGAKSFMTFRDNLVQLKVPGSLGLGDRWNKLTETVRDAIQFTEALGLRYLWVDCLCIIQDDADLRNSELENMANIFANASLVIVAAQGPNANYGLRGLKGISHPRKLNQQVHNIGNHHKFVAYLFDHGSPFSHIGDTYGTRAWTFQEHALSHRRLFFDQNAVRWECCKVAWFEEIDHTLHIEASDGSRTGEDVAEIQMTLQQTKPTMEDLALLIGSYNGRELSYDHDIDKAFAGIASILHRKSRTALISGLPAEHFDLALLWQPQSEIIRRSCLEHDDDDEEEEEGEEEAEGRPGTSTLPTWSWFGWKCEIDPQSWPCDEDGQPAFRPRSDYSKSIRYNVQTCFATPSKWFLRTGCDGATVSLDEFRNNESTSTTLYPLYSHLICRTRLCQSVFRIGRRLQNSFDGYSKLYRAFPIVHEIIDGAGNFTGVVNISSYYCSQGYSPSKDNPEFKEDCLPLEQVVGRQIDLLEISAMTISVQHKEEQGDFDVIESLEEWNKIIFDMAETNDGSFSVYNTWWVEWIDGKLAWRQALGWILSEAWDSSNLIEDDFTIG